MEKDKIPDTATVEPEAPTPAVAVAHDSNPFTTAFTGIKKLFDTNRTALAGATAFSVVVYFLIGIAGMALLVGIFALIDLYYPELLITYNPNSYAQLKELTSSLNEPAVYALLIGGVLVALVLIALLQSVQLKLATATSLVGRIGIGPLLKQSLARLPALLGVAGLYVLAIVVLIALLVALAILAQPLSVLLFLLVPVLFIGGIYVGLRLAFTSFVVVAETASPVTAFRRSWKLTRKHTIEVFGVVAASVIVIGVPMAVLDALVGSLSGPLGSVLSLIVTLIGVAASVVALMPLAERFRQLIAINAGRTPTTKVHILNYLSILILFILSMIANALAPQPNTPDTMQNQGWGTSEYQQEESTGTDTDYQLN